MSVPWSYQSGVNIDARSVLISISGLFFGFIPTLVGVSITILYRILISGRGSVPGIGIILSAALCGLLTRWLLGRRQHPTSLIHIYFMGLVTHIAMISMVFLLPMPMAGEVFSTIVIPVMIAYPLATVLLGYLLLNHQQRGKIEHQLRESEFHYRELFFKAPIPYQSLAEDGTIISVNSAWLSVLGYTEAEVVGRSFGDFIHPDYAPVFAENFPRFKADGEICGVEFRMMKKNGEQLLCSYNGRVVYDENGKFEHTQCIFDDITQRHMTETALKESISAFRKLFDNAPMGIFRSTAKGNVYHINSGFANIIGFDNAGEAFDYIKSHESKFFVNADERLTWIERLRTEAKVQNMEIQAYRRDGTVCWLMLNSVKSDYISPDDFFIEGFVIDITDRKNMSKELEVTAAIMSGVFEYMSNGSGIYEVIGDGSSGKDYIVRYFNREALRHEGKAAHEIIGKSLYELRPNINEFGLIKVMQRVYQSGTAEYLPPTRYTDETFDNWYDNWVFKLPTGEVVTIYNDVTESVRYRDSLENSKQILEKTVAERTQQLLEINKELESFAHFVSHDLKAPLRAIQGFSEMLKEDYENHLDDEGKRLLSVIIRNVQDMDNMVRELLEVSRLTRKDMKLVDCNMGELIQSCIESYPNPTELLLFNIHIDAVPIIKCDPVLMRQVWINLISNAIKYTLPSAVKSIEISAFSDASGSTFQIKDSGVGFDPKYAERVFEIFQRFHPSSEFEGSGVGLAIVQRLISKHGGRVWAESRPGVGSIFSFNIPTNPGI